MAMTLYEAIFRRQSIRKYRMEALNVRQMEHIRRFEGEVSSLYPEIQHRFVIIDALSQKDVKIQGLFKVKAPYYMALYVEDKPKAMTEAGYLMEQMVLYLTMKGIGSCYQGGAKISGLMTPVKMKLAIIIAFGMADGPLYRDEREAKRLAFNKVCIVKEELSREMLSILRACRLAPSALNRQPWRMVAYANRIHVFGQKKPGSRFGEEGSLDIGILLCHMLLTAEEMWLDVTTADAEVIPEVVPKGNQYIVTMMVKNQ